MIYDLITKRNISEEDFKKDFYESWKVIKRGGKQSKFRFILTENIDKVKHIKCSNGIIYEAISGGTMSYYFPKTPRHIFDTILGNRAFSSSWNNLIFECLEVDSDKVRAFYDKHEPSKEERKRQYANYIKNNREKKNKATRDWRKINKEKIKDYNREYSQKRRDSDINFRMRVNLRNRLRLAIKDNTKSGGLIDLLGCSIEHLKEYLESQFKDGMSWDNYGKDGWAIDHIKPCSLFDLSQECEQRDCFNYKNLQPLWGWENSAKRDRYDADF